MSKKASGDGPEGGSSLFVIVAVVAGIGLLYWLTTTFLDWNSAQECAAAGKHNCAPQIELDKQ